MREARRSSVVLYALLLSALAASSLPLAADVVLVTPAPKTLGGIHLTDSGGLEYFVNSNVTFHTTSSASGAASDAAYTHPVAADTLNGGTAPATLDDMFDGYGALCLSTDGSLGPCVVGSPSYAIYNMNGAPTTDTGGRQAVFAPQAVGSLTLQRKVYVPSTDQFARWLEIVTNSGASPVTVNLIISNNLGSDGRTKIVATSSGSLPPSVSDNWVTTFENWTGTTSPKVRIGHVLRATASTAGSGGTLSKVSFADGDDRPYWAYTVTVPAGQKKVVMHLVTGQPTRAAAAAKAAQLAGGPEAIFAGMPNDERAALVNFQGGGVLASEAVPSLGTAGLLGLAVSLAVGGALVLRRLA